jgi:hypothetical protein
MIRRRNPEREMAESKPRSQKSVRESRRFPERERGIVKKERLALVSQQALT